MGHGHILRTPVARQLLTTHIAKQEGFPSEDVELSGRTVTVTQEGDDVCPLKLAVRAVVEAEDADPCVVAAQTVDTLSVFAEIFRLQLLRLDVDPSLVRLVPHANSVEKVRIFHEPYALHVSITPDAVGQGFKTQKACGCGRRHRKRDDAPSAEFFSSAPARDVHALRTTTLRR